jgi:hypothetical protein
MEAIDSDDYSVASVPENIGASSTKGSNEEASREMKSIIYLTVV